MSNSNRLWSLRQPSDGQRPPDDNLLNPRDGERGRSRRRSRSRSRSPRSYSHSSRHRSRRSTTSSNRRSRSNNRYRSRSLSSDSLREDHLDAFSPSTYFEPKGTPKRLPFDTFSSISPAKVLDRQARQALDNYQAEYVAPNSYKHPRATEPDFDGNEINFIDFAKRMIAFLRRKKIPNYFEHYFLTRNLPTNMSMEHQAADREIYDIFTSRLTGSASSYTDAHLDTCSGHLVWADMVDTFLDQSGHRKAQVGKQLRDIQ